MLVHELCHFALHGIRGSKPRSESAIWALRNWLTNEAKRRRWTDAQLLDVAQPLQGIVSSESRTETIAGLFMRCIFGCNPRPAGYYGPQPRQVPWTFQYDGRVRPVSPQTLVDLKHILTVGMREGYVVSNIAYADAEIATFDAVVDRAVARHLLSSGEAAQQRQKWAYLIQYGSYPE